ncbi:MAG TPA: BON domain-containing protein [Chroococcales cyanobacterium]|jgi:osmotically-inducible protein OsmY
MSIRVRGDSEVLHDVLDTLASDIRLDASRIEVEVAGGVVSLKGTIPSLWQKKTAWEVIDRLKGVLSVANELKVVSEKPQRDEQIREDVLRALAGDIWVDEGRIDVKVDEGTVFLTGTVEAYTEKTYAEDDAWSVPGVCEVTNDLAIVPRLPREDEDIAVDIRAELFRNIRVDPEKIFVQVFEGKVTLRGSVQTVAQKWLADDVAWWTAGVRDVNNELYVLA